MHVQELTLRGFKSFAGTTTLRFEPGITAIVGPNGSGKSNIVDALAWVMGEQGAKTLRGSAMEDVIFAGTADRPALGRAEVSLTIDNSDHTLDIDYTQVTITRTIYRNGGSQYAINGNPCRLLDVQELLSDTGLGAHMHVIVGQGRLDQILSADPQGHRAFIEEAAGILKHRKRKERALKKLERTRDNLTRLDDILQEIGKQLAPLSRQAKAAHRADLLRAIIRDASARLLADEVYQQTQVQRETSEHIRQVRAQLQEVSQHIQSTKATISRLENEFNQNSPRMSRLQSQMRKFTALQAQFEALSALARERYETLTPLLNTRVGQEADVLAKRADELETQFEKAKRSCEQVQAHLSDITASRAGIERDIALQRQTISTIQQQAQNHNDKLAQLQTQYAQAQANVTLQHTILGELDGQLAALQHDFGEAQQHEQELQQATHITVSTEHVDQARERLHREQQSLDALLRQLHELEGSILALQARADAISDTLQSKSQSDASATHASGVMGRLSEYVRIETGWEDAVSAALEPYSSSLVVKDTHTLEQFIAENSNSPKMAVIAAQAEVCTPNVQSEGEQEGLQPSYSYAASSYIHATNPEYMQVYQAVVALLADTAIVRDASQVADAYKQGYRHVITQSAVRYSAGVGALMGRAYSQSDVSLQAKLERTQSRIQKLDTQRNRLNNDIETQRAVCVQAQEDVEHANQAYTLATLQAEQAQRERNNAHEQVLRFAKQIESLQQRMSQETSKLNQAQEAYHNMQRALAALQETGSVQDELDTLHKRVSALEIELDTAREQEMQAQLDYHNQLREQESYQRQAQLLRDQSQAAYEAQRKAQEQAEQARRKQERLQEIIRQATRARNACLSQLQILQEHINQAEQQSNENHEQLRNARTTLSDLEPKQGQLEERLHELDISREHTATLLSGLTQRAYNELRLQIPELLSQFGPQTSVELTEFETGGDVLVKPYERAEQQERLEQAQSKLAHIGKVNPLAQEEYDALQARNQYLVDQRNDVERSVNDLLELIENLDTTMQTTFEKAFADTAQAFQTVFATLFPGGEGKLALQDPEHPLTSGVLVQARPAGKRVKQLSLLSGGERSLTALAFLLAIFTARPSPFYILDEVEAALDDVNLSRLLTAFEALREHAQLLVITHQQRTMSIADALVGVSMRSDGVTTVVSQRLA